MTVEDRIRERLQAAELPYEVRRHAPVATVAEAAEARGVSPAIGGKSLVLRVGRTFRLFALPADRGLDSRAIKRRFGTSYSRFATRDELENLGGLVPGAVPPFGRPVLPLSLHVDVELTRRPRVAFTPGRCDRSILMSVEDWLEVATPEEVFPFSVAARESGRA